MKGLVFTPNPRIGAFRVEVENDESENETTIHMHFLIPNEGVYEFLWHKNSGAPILGSYQRYFTRFVLELLYFAYGLKGASMSPPEDRTGWDNLWEAVKNPK